MPNRDNSGSSGSGSDSDDPQECPQCREDAPIELEAYETWLQCDVCSEWYHGVCVGISASECERIDKYHCHRCVDKHGPSLHRESPTLRRSDRAHAQVDYTQLNEGQPATFNQYLLRLERHEFQKDEFERLDDGTQVTREWLRSRDNNDPFIVTDSKGLQMQMPDSTMTVRDVAQIIGEGTPVSVMDVLTQEELSGWTLGDWAAYFHGADRRRVLNVISLEISDTPLGERVRRPQVVDDVDLVDRYWPEAKRKPGKFPRVRTYCLMSVQNAYTDFHIDFSATWVYYHVLSGEKVFYLIPPTPSNMRKFEAWSRSPEQSVSLFAEHVRQCFEVRVCAGQTMFIPAGWIHAVLTPKDAVVIGGNFLVMASLNTHIGAYKLEARTRVPTRYRFPFFLKLCRYMAELLAKRWSRMDRTARARWTVSELEGVFVLACFLDEKLLRHDLESEEAKALGDRQAVKKHTARLLDLVGNELATRMIPEEWHNRELQLREGCHFRWIRPGMPQGSMLLAARPRRSRAAGGVDATADKSITKIRQKTAERSESSKNQPRMKLVRGRQKSSASDTTASNGDNASHENDGDEDVLDQEDDIRVALGSSGGSRTHRLESDSDQSSSSSSCGSSEDSNDDSDGDSGVSEGSAESDIDNFVVSDSDDQSKIHSRKRKVTHMSSSISLGRSSKHSVVQPSTVKLKGAKQRIAERLKLKF
ncbi:JmjC domain-containing histone demethylation protein 1 [Coemansia sp. Benny D115]|nr:JmjC domain-containing histone demethylation protein 1 [Coemansia sp. Benny D115]